MYHISRGFSPKTPHEPKAYTAQGRHQRAIYYAKISLSHPEPLSQEQLYEVNRQCALSLKHVGSPADALPYWERALYHASTEGERVLAVLEVAGACGNRQQATVIREQVLASIDESTDSSLIIDVFIDLAGRMSFQGVESVTRVLKLVRQRGDKEAEARVLRCLSMMQLAIGDMEIAIATIQHAARLVDELGDDELRGTMQMAIASVISRSPNPLAAVEHLYRGRYICERAGLDIQTFWSTLGDIYRKAKQYDVMIEPYKKVLEKLEHEEALRDTWEESISALAYLVQGYAYQGDWGEAYHYFWRMIDSMGTPARKSFDPGKDAVAFLCHKDRTGYRWAYEGIPSTMKRAKVY